MAQDLQAQKTGAQVRSRALEVAEGWNDDLSLAPDAYDLIARAQDLLRELVPNDAVVYYEREGDTWWVWLMQGSFGSEGLAGAHRAGLPHATTDNLRLPFETRQPYYQDVYDQQTDGLGEHMGHVASTAMMPLLTGQGVRGVFGVARFGQGVWTPAERALIETVTRSLRVALDRAERISALEEERAASQAFVQFTEAASRTASLDDLARPALDTLQTLLPGCSAVFFELRGERWSVRQVTDTLSEDLLSVLEEGLPLDTPAFAQVQQAEAPLFIGGWNAAEQRIEHTAQVQSAALYPVMQDGAVRAVLLVVLEEQPRWTAREQGVVLAVGRSFSLLYDRLSAAQDLQVQKGEAEGRTRALEAFAELTSELDIHHEPLRLIRRALEIALSLLPPGYGAYWEPVGGLWRALVQVGDVGSGDLQQLLDAGLPVGGTPTLDRPYQSRQPQFDDAYDADTDVDSAEVPVDHLKSIACLPVLVGGRVIGIFNVPLFETRAWSASDRAILISAARSLSLTLEGGNETLNLANAELEAFAYSASHDLRTSVRHVQGFTDLLLRSIEAPSEKTQRYGQVVLGAAERMNTLIDAMLLLSRAGRSELHLGAVDLNLLTQQAQQDAALEFPQVRVIWNISTLPTVQGDAATLQQVLSNLLSNAVKYSSKVEAPVVEVWAQEEPDAWRVSVRDNGVGFDPKYQHKLFGVFQRLQGEGEYEGTGIGLATVKRIVQRHGGQVFAEGILRQGATFGFTLPR